MYVRVWRRVERVQVEGNTIILEVKGHPPLLMSTTIVQNLFCLALEGSYRVCWTVYVDMT